MRWFMKAAHMGEMRNACKILNRKYDRNRPPRRPRYTMEDNIKIVLTAIVCMYTGFIWLKI
jgi:hypothetical protein